MQLAVDIGEKGLSCMRPLLKGIQLFGSGVDMGWGGPRVWLSAGVSLACASTLVSTPYSTSAVIPAEPWREPTPAEWAILWRQEPPQDWSACVGLVRVPDEILAPFDQIGIGSVISAQDRDALIAHPDCPQALTGVVAYLTTLSRSDHRPRTLGLAFKPPGLHTVTFDESAQCYIGLHLDNWDRLPLSQRDQSRNRICINLGCEDRFLLFVNLTLMDISRFLADSNARIGTTALGQAFMIRYASYPVVKVRIAPREAYIAPTENMIHDGCTLNKQYPDLHLTFLGDFGIPR